MLILACIHFKVLMQLHTDLYVEVNDAETWFGSAQKYLDTEFDY